MKEVKLNNNELSAMIDTYNERAKKDSSYFTKWADAEYHAVNVHGVGEGCGEEGLIDAVNEMIEAEDMYHVIDTQDVSIIRCVICGYDFEEGDFITYVE